MIIFNCIYLFICILQYLPPTYRITLKKKYPIITIQYTVVFGNVIRCFIYVKRPEIVFLLLLDNVRLSSSSKKYTKKTTLGSFSHPSQIHIKATFTVFQMASKDTKMCKTCIVHLALTGSPNFTKNNLSLHGMFLQQKRHLNSGNRACKNERVLLALILIL